MRRRFTSGEWIVGGFVAVCVHILLLAAVSAAEAESTQRRPPPLLDRGETLRVSIDDSAIPLLALGTQRPGAVAEQRHKPSSAPRRSPRRSSPSAHLASELAADSTATPDPHATSAVAPVADTAATAPDAPAASASERPSAPDPTRADAPAGSAIAEAPAPPPAKGVEDGATEGTETDPLRGQQLRMYRSTLDGWFSARFAIRGKLPFAALEKLSAAVDVSIDDARRVLRYVVVRPSGDRRFDDALRASLDATIGASLPPPPRAYADALGGTLHLVFKCTVRSQCE
jgi:hypothetical protein